MDITEEQVIEYKRHHKFERDIFIEQIRMMHQVAVELREKPRIKIDEIEKWDDPKLIKAHRFYWNKL